MSLPNLSLRARRALWVAVAGVVFTAPLAGVASVADARALPGDPGAPVSATAASLGADPLEPGSDATTPTAGSDSADSDPSTPGTAADEPAGSKADAPARDDAAPEVGNDAAQPDGTAAAAPEPPAPSEPAGLFAHCPLMGPSTFEDTWGWARSGGRRHEGVDMIAARGTWIIAVRDGFAEFKTNSLGGRAIWLTAPNGDRFYYAHLDAWEGESREVEAGDLIGYVGTSGNAGTPHLHFETLPGGIVENPYPHTLRACVPTPEELAAAGLSPEGEA